MTITHIGSIESGTVQCPLTLVSFPFTKGKPFDVPVNVAAALVSQSPSDWKTEKSASNQNQKTEQD